MAGVTLTPGPWAVFMDPAKPTPISSTRAISRSEKRRHPAQPSHPDSDQGFRGGATLEMKVNPNYFTFDDGARDAMAINPKNDNRHTITGKDAAGLGDQR